MNKKRGTRCWQQIVLWVPVFGILALLALQQSSPPVPQPVTSSRGVHDGNLDVYFIDWVSPYVALPVNPDRFTPDTLPGKTQVQRLGKTSPQAVAVVGLHSIQVGRFGIWIEAVRLRVARVRALPPGVNVWQQGLTEEPAGSSIQGFYSGEGEGVSVGAALPHGLVLDPGEAQDIAISVVSQEPVDLTFQMQVIYRVTNESQYDTLTLQQPLEIQFTDDWHRYDWQSGHFVPASAR